MPIRLTDTDISALVSERKELAGDPDLVGKLRPNNGSLRVNREITTVRGSFRIALRQTIENPLDFSALLIYRIPNTNVDFRLRRYNGNSHEHPNRIEGTRVRGYHIHFATERYQERGLREDGYAEATNRYVDLRGAYNCLLADCNVQIEKGPQRGLGEWVNR